MVVHAEFWLPTSQTHTPPAVNTSWKKAFTFASMSERKLKDNDSSLMCKMWYESLPSLHIITCKRACSLFTHSHRVYIYKCTGTWPRVDNLQHTCTSFLLAWKNSCALSKKVLILAVGVAKISCYLAKQFLKKSSLEFSQLWMFWPGWTECTGKDCTIHIRHVYCWSATFVFWKNGYVHLAGPMFSTKWLCKALADWHKW